MSRKSESNAFIHRPRLPSPNKARLHSHSASRSPARQHARDIDPLLRDLSPTTTLRSFATEPRASSHDDGNQVLSRSIENLSSSERALGVKAAQACLDLRAWTRELDSWDWPGVLDACEPACTRIPMSTMTSNSILSREIMETTDPEDEKEEGHWASLPARTVQAYEKRADEIGQALDQIDVEELKEYVLVSHYRADCRPPSRDGSIGPIASATEIKRLDDFTALITATILQALPYLARLNRLLDLWTIRLLVLRDAPDYLLDLRRARRDVDDGWAAIAVSSANSNPGPGRANFDRQTMAEMKTMIERQVNSLGRRLDRFLDHLEGREDTVPNSWIDDFESLESAYGDWVVQAERRILELEWGAGNAEPAFEHSKTSADGESMPSSGISELVDPTFDDQLVTRASKGALATSATAKSRTDSPGPYSSDYHLSAPAQDRSQHSLPADLDPHSVGLADKAALRPEEAPENLAKKRAAFLNDIERTNSLKLASKTPVRPFEHASNAFTRLFKKDRSPEQVRPKRSTNEKLHSNHSMGDNSISGKRSRRPSLSSGRRNVVFSDLSDSMNSTSTSSRTSPSIGIGMQASQNEGGTHYRASQHSAHETIRDGKNITASNATRTTPPATYQPTGLCSPFKSQDQADYPQDWPLVSPIDTPVERLPRPAQGRRRSTHTKHGSDSGPEINTPIVALQTDVFDRMFVQTLPQTLAERPASSRTPRHSSSSPQPINRRRTASLPRTAHRISLTHGNTASYLDMVSNRTCRPLLATQSSFNKNQKRSASASSATNSTRAASPGRSDTGLPSSIPHCKGQEPKPISLSLPLGSKSPIGHTSLPHLLIPDPPSFMPHMQQGQTAKRVSVACIEAFSRSELKTIEVQRTSKRNSLSPRVTPPETPPRAKTPPGSTSSCTGRAHENSTMSSKGMVSFPTPPQPSTFSTPPSESTTPTAMSGSEQDSPVVNKSTRNLTGESADASTPSLNAAMLKRHEKQHSGSAATSFALPSKKQSSHETPEDSFDRHVSEVLDLLPAQIRFKARPGAESSLSQSSDAQIANAPFTKNMRASPKNGAMTIAPAGPSPKKSGSNNSEPEIKLYHLTQAGRDEPIKLFVRLVGEGERERVMVRVGGGWADLETHLRQYAEHHGSRTVSEGALEVQTMSSVPLSRKVSGPADSVGKARAPFTPINATPRPTSKDSDRDWPSYSQPTISSINGRSTPVHDNDRQTPGPSTGNSTPKSTAGSSRPSTANVSRPSSRQGPGEVGLAGTSSGKKPGLPEHKAKWVEGMIERAKKASAEKSKEEREKHFSEIGKAGNTRRVIFKST